MKTFGGNFGTRLDGNYGTTWKRGSNINLSIAIHYLHKIEPKSPQLCKCLKYEDAILRGYWGHVTKLAWKRGSHISCTGKPLKVSWRRKRLRKVLLGVCHPCNQTYSYCKGYYVTMLAWKRGWHNSWSGEHRTLQKDEVWSIVGR